MTACRTVDDVAGNMRVDDVAGTSNIRQALSRAVLEFPHPLQRCQAPALRGIVCPEPRAPVRPRPLQHLQGRHGSGIYREEQRLYKTRLCRTADGNGVKSYVSNERKNTRSM
jgi:hypothetical protein